MQKLARPYHRTISVLSIAVGCAAAGIALRLLLMPAGFVDRTSAVILAEGGIGWYAATALVFGLLTGLAGAVFAIIYNEIA
jgi:hypothetical protein